MNQQPDKLFRDKLQGYQRPVPPVVWKRITEEGTLKTRRVFLLKTAATVLLLATAGALIYPFIQDHSSAVVKNKQKTVPQTIESPAPAQAKKNEQPGAEHDNAKKGTEPVITQAPIAKKHTSESPSASLKGTISQQHQETTAIVISSPEPEPIIPPKLTAQLPNRSLPPDAGIAPRKTVTIVFTVEEVNQKYLSRASAAQATSEGKESSRLQNLLDKAQDLKHNQDPLGEIRQKKNEILAMNFKKEKPSTQND